MAKPSTQEIIDKIILLESQGTINKPTRKRLVQEAIDENKKNLGEGIQIRQMQNVPTDVQQKKEEQKALDYLDGEVKAGRLLAEKRDEILTKHGIDRPLISQLKGLGNLLTTDIPAVKKLKDAMTPAVSQVPGKMLSPFAPEALSPLPGQDSAIKEATFGATEAVRDAIIPFPTGKQFKEKFPTTPLGIATSMGVGLGQLALIKPALKSSKLFKKILPKINIFKDRRKRKIAQLFDSRKKNISNTVFQDKRGRKWVVTKNNIIKGALAAKLITKEGEVSEQEETFSMGQASKKGFKVIGLGIIKSKEELVKELQDSITQSKDKVKKLVDVLEKGKAAVQMMQGELPGLTDNKDLRAIKSINDQIMRDIKSGKGLTYDRSKNVVGNIINLVATNQIQPDDAAEILGVKFKGKKQLIKFAKTLQDPSTASGKHLNALSQVKRQFLKRFGNDPDIVALLKDGEGPSWFTRVMDKYRDLDNVRRAFIVSQVATSSRNIQTQGITVAGRMFENALADSMGVVFRGDSPTKALNRNIENITDFISLSMSKGKGDEVFQTLDEFSTLNKQLMRTPLSEGSLGKDGPSEIVNSLNSWQESSFRAGYFGMLAHDELRQRGITPSQFNLLKAEDQFPMLQGWVGKALDVTFASPPRGGLGKGILETYKTFPILTVIGPTFPRFWMNSLAFMRDHNPLYNLGTMAISKETRKKYLAETDARKRFAFHTRATLGSMMIGAGYAMDKMGKIGERAWQFKVGDDEVMDMRPFSPHYGQVFIGRYLSQAQEKGAKEAYLDIPAEDWTTALASMRRSDMTGIPIADLALNLKGDALMERIIGIAGDWVGGFTVPARTVLDLGAQFIREERVPRGTHEGFKTVEDIATPGRKLKRTLSGFITPSIGNIPGAQQSLPVRRTAFGEVEERISPFFRRQLLGQSITRPSVLENEARSLGLDTRKYFPHFRPRNKVTERLALAKVSPLYEQFMTNLMESDVYKGGSRGRQRVLFDMYARQLVTLAKNQTVEESPNAIIDAWINRMSALEIAMKNEEGDVDALITIMKQQLSGMK